MVYFRAGFDEYSSNVNFERLPCYGMRKSSQPSNILDVYGEATRCEVCESVEVSETSGWA